MSQKSLLTRVKDHYVANPTSLAIDAISLIPAVRAARLGYGLIKGLSTAVKSTKNMYKLKAGQQAQKNLQTIKKGSAEAGEVFKNLKKLPDSPDKYQKMAKVTQFTKILDRSLKANHKEFLFNKKNALKSALKAHSVGSKITKAGAITGLGIGGTTLLQVYTPQSSYNILKKK
tara:strand:- start:5250 stop:5768 length:519 start_codon:yes stop_codon:yes gene_type:complete